jgi:hypothetical protein
MRKTSAYARRRWAPDPLASLRLLDRARPFDAGDTTEQHIKTRAAFERLENGTADNDDFDRVAMAINLAKIRALEIDRALADLLEAGQTAMTSVRKRQERWDKWEVLPAEREAIVEALAAHEAITDASSPLQMHEALDVVRRSVMKNMRKAA